MRIAHPCLALLLVAACSDGSEDADAPNVGQAAADAQANIDRYAAETPVTNTARSPSPRPQATPPAAIPSPVPASPGPEPSPGIGAADARTLVERYYALIAAGRYADARALWGGDGAESGLDPGTFAASFRRFSRYRAQVGEPFDQDAGAGQVYISVPVRIAGTLRDGDRPYRSAGTVILHRVNPGIDGTTAADRRWTIRRFDSVPAASPTAASPADPVARP